MKYSNFKLFIKVLLDFIYFYFQLIKVNSLFAINFKYYFKFIMALFLLKSKLKKNSSIDQDLF
jgi:hypothetical protein